MADGAILVGDAAGPVGAPAVILMHGGGQTRHSWAGAMGRLVAAGHRVISYDARGHGDSSWSPGGIYSVPGFASDLAMVRATLPGPAALVGASMGGLTGFYAAGANPPDFASALVLVDVVPRPAAAGIDKIERFMSAHHAGFATLEDAVAAVAAYNPERPRPSDPSGLRRNLRRRDDGRLYWHWDPRILAMSPQAEPPVFTRDPLAVSARVTLPTLLARGGDSDVVDAAGIAELRALLPQTEVHEVAGDRNDAFNQAIIAFLARHLTLA